MRVPCNKDVDVELPLQRGERVAVAPRHDLVAVAKSDAKAAERRKHACVGRWWRGSASWGGRRRARVVKVTGDDV
jgi:hypothetical protein